MNKTTEWMKNEWLNKEGKKLKNNGSLNKNKLFQIEVIADPLLLSYQLKTKTYSSNELFPNEF